jgi:hypothetical protein
MKIYAGAVAVGCVAALAAGGTAWAASGEPNERPPTKLWSEFPLVPPAPPAAGGVAGVRAEARRPAPVPAQIDLSDGDSPVPSGLWVAFIAANALFLGGAALLIIRARARRLATAPAGRPGAARPRASRPHTNGLPPLAAARSAVGAVCAIAVWPSVAGSRFCALSGNGRALPVALSPPFEGNPLDETDEARRALDELLGVLSAAGWEPSGRGEEWFELRFRRAIR